MTREEAIDTLKAMQALQEIYRNEAVDMAIEALSEKNIAREIATILENEQDMRVILQNAERPKGEWNKFDTGIYLCSNCNWAVGNEYNYCPCCGSRMKGGAE